MEFLMTYGWAILVVILAIGALAYLGVLDPNKLLGDRCTINTGSGIFCDDYNNLAVPDQINLNLKNANSNPVNITYLNFSFNNGANSCGFGNVTLAGPGSGVIQPDQVLSFNLSFNNNGTAGSQFPNCALVKGTKAKGDLTIYYSFTNNPSALPKRTTGQMVITSQ